MVKKKEASNRCKNWKEDEKDGENKDATIPLI